MAILDDISWTCALLLIVWKLTSSLLSTFFGCVFIIHKISPDQSIEPRNSCLYTLKLNDFKANLLNKKTPILMCTMKHTCRAAHATPTKVLRRLISVFLSDHQNILNLVAPIMLETIVPNYLHTMAHKAQPPNPNVSNELKIACTVATECLLCLLLTGSKVILDEFYQVKLQQPAASFSSPSCTAMLKFLSVT